MAINHHSKRGHTMSTPAHDPCQCSACAGAIYGIREAIFGAPSTLARDDRGSAAALGLLLLVLAVVMLDAVFGDQAVSDKSLVEALLLGAALGAPVPLIAGALNPKDARLMSKLGMMCRAELALAMGVVAGMTALGVAELANQSASAVTIVLAAATGAAGALQVARGLVARAASVITVIDADGTTTNVPVGAKDAVEVAAGSVTIKKGGA